MKNRKGKTEQNEIQKQIMKKKQQQQQPNEKRKAEYKKATAHKM